MIERSTIECSRMLRDRLVLEAQKLGGNIYNLIGALDATGDDSTF